MDRRQQHSNLPLTSPDQLTTVSSSANPAALLSQSLRRAAAIGRAALTAHTLHHMTRAIKAPCSSSNNSNGAGICSQGLRVQPASKGPLKGPGLQVPLASPIKAAAPLLPYPAPNQCTPSPITHQCHQAAPTAEPQPASSTCAMGGMHDGAAPVTRTHAPHHMRVATAQPRNDGGTEGLGRGRVVSDRALPTQVKSKGAHSRSRQHLGRHLTAEPCQKPWAGHHVTNT